MSKIYSLTLNSMEVKQLLEVLDTQAIIPPESSILLINKIQANLSPELSNALSSDPQSLDLSTSLTTIAEIFKSIAQTLETIVPQLPMPTPQSLGFTTHYRREIIYCEAHRGSYWHLRNEWQQLIPIHGRALTCIVQGLITQGLKTDDPEPKLQLNVQADKLYGLALPLKSLLTTTLLTAIDQLSAQQLQLPITIEPIELPNTQELTCRVYYQGSLLKLPEIGQPLPRLIKHIQSKLQESFSGHF